MAPNTLDAVTKKSESIQDSESSLKSRAVSGVKKLVDERSNAIDTNQEETVFKPQIRWPDLIAQIFVHVGFLYGLYYLISLQAKFYTYIWCKFNFDSSRAVENQFLFNFFSCRAGLYVRNWNHSRYKELHNAFD